MTDAINVEAHTALLKQAITASLYPESSWMVIPIPHPTGIVKGLKRLFLQTLEARGYILVKKRPFNLETRLNGADWPMFGYSMIGHKRLENLDVCIGSVLHDGIPGDFVECGVWRGGASIYARAILNFLGGADRTVWLADSFEGMPIQRPEDKDDPATAGTAQIIVPLEEVQANFSRFGLLGDNVRFLKGWFCDTLPGSPIKEIAILRLDGDYYSSTMDALTALYDRVSPGGYVIIDDYHCFKSCARAVEDFCRARKIDPKLLEIDGEAVYWRKG
jgi:O-methyltransferase